MSSSQPDQTTSGTKSIPTNEPEAQDTKHLEHLVEGLEDHLSSAPSPEETSPQRPTESNRRFILILKGTVPGLNLEEERTAIIRQVEMALMGLHATHGIVLMGAGYRSDPTQERSEESAPTDTVPDATDTDEPASPSESSPSESSSPGSSDGSPSQAPEPASDSSST